MGFIEMSKDKTVEELLVWLAEETSELADIIFFNKGNKDDTIESEIADVFNVLMAIAKKYNLTVKQLLLNASKKSFKKIGVHNNYMEEGIIFRII